MAIQVLVTGYGGFLGQAICHDLIANGFRVRGLARNHYPELELSGVECIRGSAVDPSVCERACQGVHAVIHTAALAGVWGPAKQYEESNILATENLLRSADRQQLRAFVFTSSPSVVFSGEPQRDIDESAPYPTRWLCHYPRTKAIAEQRVLDRNHSRLATCALRPHLVWGKGDPHLIPRVIERCRQGRLLRVGDGRNLIDTVHVDAAAEAHRLALVRMLEQDQQASGRAYFLTDNQPLECWQWIRTILSFAGLSAPERSISLRSAYVVGAILEQIYGVLRKSSEPPMTRFVAKQLGVDHTFCIDSARERLGYNPPTDREALVQELIRHWKTQR